MPTRPARPGDDALAAQVIARAASADYEAWWASVEHSGYCTNPIHLTGKDDDGKPVTVLARCGNRRAAVCPSCSDLYAADTWQLVQAGVAGGRHGMPSSVADHPMVFLTLTAPSFGPVHTRQPAHPMRRCRPRRVSAPTHCEHGQPTGCQRVHGPDDVFLGQALCTGCYDYLGHVLFAWHLPEMWHRFAISLRREIARESRLLGLPTKPRLSYVKVAEMQRRAVPHLHTLLRLDAANQASGDPAPGSAMSAEHLARVARRVASTTRLTVEGPLRTANVVRLGEQLDAQPLLAAGITVDDSPTGHRVATYLAKYVTKSVTDLGVGPRRISEKAIDTLNVTAHVRAVLRTIVSLADDPGPPEMVRWLHTLGYRGHVTTKTRDYSTTMTALRAQRHAWRASNADGEPGGPSPWTFTGHGHQSDGERLLAASAARQAIGRRRVLREALRDDRDGKQ